jgi:hypothetical protein
MIFFKENKNTEIEYIMDPSKQIEILKEYHDSPTGGHQGAKRTYERLKLIYKWPKLIAGKFYRLRMTNINHIFIQSQFDIITCMHVIFRNITRFTIWASKDTLYYLRSNCRCLFNFSIKW